VAPGLLPVSVSSFWPPQAVSRRVGMASATAATLIRVFPMVVLFLGCGMWEGILTAANVGASNDPEVRPS
jgi:hypothetical protein